MPAAEGFLLLIRQRLAPALLPHGAAGAQAEVEIVEDLRRFVRHVIQCTSLLRRCRYAWAWGNPWFPHESPPSKSKVDLLWQFASSTSLIFT